MAESKTRKSNEENDNSESGVEQELDKKYIPSNPNQIVPGMSDNIKEEMEQTRVKLEKLKKELIKKYPFVECIGILPPQGIDKFLEDEELTDPQIEEIIKEKRIHLMIIIPEDKFKEMVKIKSDIVKSVEKHEPKLWVHVKTPVDIFNYGLDSKYDLISSFSMSFPLYDRGLLGAMRVAEIHKSLVLRKFEKYVSSYVLGGSLVRGTATKTSDVDIFVIIDDTDVKRMPRLELKEKLRSIIYQYIAEASELAGVKNILNVQVYIMTEFWEGVKDAHPVFFTFIRDGIPLYDRGTFLPWKLLLKMGKIKPSPEAIELYMSSGDKMSEIIKRRLLDIVMGDIYWGVLTPSQALVMLYGLPPPTHKEAPAVFRETFVEKEKLIEKKYADILQRIIEFYRDYEHGKVKEVSGAEVDKFMKDAEDYMKRLKELRVQIEKRAQEKTIDQIYEDLFSLLKGIFGKKSEQAIVQEFEDDFAKKGKVPPTYLNILKDVVKARQQFKKGKLATHEVEDARKNASILINYLIEYNQRKEFMGLEKGRIRIKYWEAEKEKVAEVVLVGGEAFLIQEVGISRITADKLEPATQIDLEKAITKQKEGGEIRATSAVFEVLRKALGEFELGL